MALMYTQDHNWWVQRVNKELMATSRFNMYHTRSTFYSGTKNSGFLRSSEKYPNRPLTSKSVASLSNKSASRSEVRVADDLKSSEQGDKHDDGMKKGQGLEVIVNQDKASNGLAPASRPSSNQFSIRSGKSRPSTGIKASQSNYLEKVQEDLVSVGGSSANFSTKSVKGNEDSETLKNYIKELEKLLRFEKIKRIQTEDSLKRLVSKSSAKSIQRLT